MKITLYSVPEDRNGKLIKKFLQKNNIPFKEIITNKITLLESIARTKLQNQISLLKITYGSGINVIIGFNELALNQLIEHIEKYKLKFY